ncbi:dephospho-CoA kinase [Methanomicrobium sp. W14]|uniref:AAA family ATPase n=1 Tax=Methanomicrobium sp. W14 TaxID=2817839 RepID=UPI001AE87242|nr:AAA family ATPase [Methanomicrobium sp. W14]MBP2132306.1 dephospho-CoA kinase [Methanomicrobium sp. W14]
MQVIGVVGLPASGKGEFSRIAKDMNIPVVVMGDVVRKAVLDAGLKINDKNMGEMSRCLRQGMGMDALAQLTVPIIDGMKSGVVLVDGIRGDSEVETFMHHFKNFSLVAVKSPFETRLKRLCERKREDDESDKKGLKERDERETGWGLLDAMSMAEYEIDNEGTIEEFEAKVRDVIEKIRNKNEC